MTEPSLIRPSVNEIRHLLARAFIEPVSDPGHLLRASHRRRLHQTRAKISYYRSAETPSLKICECSTGLGLAGGFVQVFPVVAGVFTVYVGLGPFVLRA